jgi:hypothetical protein
MLSEYNDICSVGLTADIVPSGKRGRSSYPMASRALRYYILRRFEIDLGITGVPEQVLPEIAKLGARPQDPDVDLPRARSPPFPDGTDAVRIHEKPPTGAARDYTCPLLPPIRSRRRPPRPQPTQERRSYGRRRPARRHRFHQAPIDRGVAEHLRAESPRWARPGCPLLSTAIATPSTTRTSSTTVDRVGHGRRLLPPRGARQCVAATTASLTATAPSSPAAPAPESDQGRCPFDPRRR